MASTNSAWSGLSDWKTKDQLPVIDTSGSSHSSDYEAAYRGTATTPASTRYSAWVAQPKTWADLAAAVTANKLDSESSSGSSHRALQTANAPIETRSSAEMPVPSVTARPSTPYVAPSQNTYYPGRALGQPLPPPNPDDARIAKERADAERFWHVPDLNDVSGWVNQNVSAATNMLSQPFQEQRAPVTASNDAGVGVALRQQEIADKARNDSFWTLPNPAKMFPADMSRIQQDSDSGVRRAETENVLREKARNDSFWQTPSVATMADNLGNVTEKALGATGYALNQGMMPLTPSKPVVDAMKSTFAWDIAKQQLDAIDKRPMQEGMDWGGFLNRIREAVGILGNVSMPVGAAMNPLYSSITQNAAQKAWENTYATLQNPDGNMTAAEVYARTFVGESLAGTGEMAVGLLNAAITAASAVGELGHIGQAAANAVETGFMYASVPGQISQNESIRNSGSLTDKALSEVPGWDHRMEVRGRTWPTYTTRVYVHVHADVGTRYAYRTVGVGYIPWWHRGLYELPSIHNNREWVNTGAAQFLRLFTPLPLITTGENR